MLLTVSRLWVASIIANAVLLGLLLASPDDWRVVLAIMATIVTLVLLCRSSF